MLDVDRFPSASSRAKQSCTRNQRTAPMPALTNPKHELFAQGLASGLSASAAYEAAGYTPNDGNAIRLKGNERVRRRVEELQKIGEERALLTLEAHMMELETLRELAKKNNQTS